MPRTRVKKGVCSERTRRTVDRKRKIQNHSGEIGARNILLKFNCGDHKQGEKLNMKKNIKLIKDKFT